MNISDLLYLSAQNIKIKRSRFLFTILGVSIGVGTVLFLVSLGLGLQRNLHDSITTKDSLLTLDIVSQEAQIMTINDQSLEAIAQIPNVDLVSPQAVVQSQISLVSRQLTSETTFNVVGKDFLRLSGIVPEVDNTTNYEGPTLVANYSVAELFNMTPEELLGQKVSFIVYIPETDQEGVQEIVPHAIEQTFTVAGIAPQTSGAPSEVYVDRDYLRDLPITDYQFAKVKVRSNENLEPVREQLIELGFLVSSLSDTIAQADKIFGIIQIILGIFGIVALFVAAIGLVNTMTISLLERTQEIGIMRAIGAPPSDIQKLFLGESFLTGFLGGIGGVIIGIGTGEFFNMLVNILAQTLKGDKLDLFYYSPKFIFFIIVLSCVVGFIAGLWPAHRAAKLDPIDALRYK